MTVIEHLADWAANVSVHHPETARERAKRAFQDVIGCMIAGAGDAGVARVRDSIAGWGTGAATVIGQSTRVPAPWAALVNGTAAHALDFDDEFLEALTHASAVLVPALLAIGEERDAPGAAVLDAYIVGIELHAALGRGVIRSHYDRGWHATSTIGCIGTAGACARLSGLDAGKLAHSLSLGVSMAAGCKVQFGSMAKPLHAGLAAQHAIQAAQMAASGVEGRLNALEGPMGFLDLCGGPSPAGWGGRLDSLGAPLAIVRQGLMPKRFPCCTATHRVLDCVLKLREEAGFQAEDVVSVDVLVGHGHKKNLMFETPQTEFEARFSMQYCVAVALRHGAVKLADFTPEAVQRPDVRALLGVTKMRAYDPGAEQSDPAAALPHEVDIALRDGRRLHASRTTLKGSVGDPLEDAECEAKFVDCCHGFLLEADIGRLRRDIFRIEALDSIRALTRHLADRRERFEHPSHF